MPGKRHSSPFHKILVGYDGSKPAQKALEIAFAMAQSEDAKLFVVAIARPSEPATRVETTEILENAQEHFEQDFQRMTARAKELHLSLETAVGGGHPTEQLLHRAETCMCRCVVWSPLKRAFVLIDCRLIIFQLIQAPISIAVWRFPGSCSAAFRKLPRANWNRCERNLRRPRKLNHRALSQRFKRVPRTQDCQANAMEQNRERAQLSVDPLDRHNRFATSSYPTNCDLTLSLLNK
jgi:Universal stress protein family